MKFKVCVHVSLCVCVYFRRSLVWGTTKSAWAHTTTACRRRRCCFIRRGPCRRRRSAPFSRYGGEESGGFPHRYYHHARAGWCVRGEKYYTRFRGSLPSPSLPLRHPPLSVVLLQPARALAYVCVCVCECACDEGGGRSRAIDRAACEGRAATAGCRGYRHRRVGIGTWARSIRESIPFAIPSPHTSVIARTPSPCSRPLTVIAVCVCVLYFFISIFIFFIFWYFRFPPMGLDGLKRYGIHNRRARAVYK